jgi:PRTRC genetic system protein C
MNTETVKPTVILRQFKWKKEIIPDPDSSLHPNEVVNYLSENEYPEMLNATVKYGKIEGDLESFEISLKGSDLG